MKKVFILTFIFCFLFAVNTSHARRFSTISSLGSKVKRMNGQLFSIRLKVVSKNRRSVILKDSLGSKLIVYVRSSVLKRKLRKLTLNRTFIFRMRIRKTLAVNRRIGANYGMRGHTRIKMIVSTIDWE